MIYPTWRMIFVDSPAESKRAPSKENNHRAMDDIRESIKELEFYKENIFKASKSRK